MLTILYPRRTNTTTADTYLRVRVRASLSNPHFVELFNAHVPAVSCTAGGSWRDQIG
jgi:hypothetical protein